MKIIEERRSTREFLDKEISEDILEKLVSSAILAPSAFNFQPWKFVVVSNKKKKQEIREIYDSATEKIKLLKKLHLTNVPIYNQDTLFLERATLIVPCYNKTISYARDSLAMACENLMLEAVNQNLGSVCVGRPTVFNNYRKKIKKIADVSKEYEIPYLIAVGYSDFIPSKPKRKSIKEIMKRIK